MPTVRTYRRLLLLLAAVVLAADLGSKYGVFRWLYHDGQPLSAGEFESWVPANTWRDGRAIPMLLGGRYNLVPGWFGFTAEYLPASRPSEAAWLNSLQTWSAPIMPHVNHGALFGLGNDHEHRANSIFAGVSLLAALAILVWGLRRANAADRWLSIGLGLILGGTLGNLFDRVVFGGVRDFLYFYRIEWPVFNVADCGLVVGAAILLGQAVLCSRCSSAAEPTAAQNAVA